MTENAVEQKTSPGRFKPSRWMILIVGTVLIFVCTYFLAWWSAYHLSQTYLKDADASYNDGRYMDAFRGYEKYNESSKKYVQYGGYTQVERIWADKYASPMPSEVNRAKKRIDEIINERLTIADAEQFVQENIGRDNPYLGRIYLRLGELYEANGQLRDAESIYADIPHSFPKDKKLIARAMQDLENLRSKP